MNKLWKGVSLSAIVSAIFYYPLIKLYNYIENNIGGTEIEDEEYR